VSATATLLRLDGELTIYRASELKPLLLDPLLAGDLEIDLSAVTEIDSAGVQLLMLAKRDAAASQRSLRLALHSPAVLEVFQLLDLAAYFGDPLVIPASHTA
jgi:anti-sigma B factor antagonist